MENKELEKLKWDNSQLRSELQKKEEIIQSLLELKSNYSNDLKHRENYILELESERKVVLNFLESEGFGQQDIEEFKVKQRVKEKHDDFNT